MNDPELEEFAAHVADGVKAFLLSVQEICRTEEAPTAIPRLLVEISQILFTGARLGAQADFSPEQEYQPDTGPDPDLDEMRLRLAQKLDNLDTYSFTLDPYESEIATSQISDDIASIVTELTTGLRHYDAGNVGEALWWWQFSYVSSWGATASGVLRALQSVVAHDRLDTEYVGEADQIEAAEELLATDDAL